MIYYHYIKALHIIFVVSWFAGLFYLVRLFIYHTEAQNASKIEQEILSKQFEKMENLLWRVITQPAMVLTVIMGLIMIYLLPNYLQTSWMQLKIAFVIGLLAYHFYCKKLMQELKNGIFRFTSFQLRLWNELATIFLVSVVFLVVLKNSIDWIYGFVGFFAFGLFMLFLVKFINKNRKN